MVEVFVHAATPLGGSQGSEERMRVTGTPCLAALVERPYTTPQPLLLPCKIPRVTDDEFFVGGIVLGEGLLVRVDWLHKRANNPANQHARRIQLSRRHVERAGAMRQHLCHIHLAPLALCRGLQAIDAPDDLVDGFFLE